MTRGYLRFTIIMLLAQLVSELIFSYVLEYPSWLGWRGLTLLTAVVALIGLVSSFNVLKYFAWKKLWWTFTACLITTALSAFTMYAFYLMGSGMIGVEVYILAYLVTWVSISHYGLSIILSAARKRFWLLVYGIVLLLLAAPYLLMLAVYGMDYDGSWGYIANYSVTFSVLLVSANMYGEIRQLYNTSDDLIDG